MRSTRAVRFWFNPPRRRAEPYLFISYGMTKCGSTLAFQLARVALIQAGYAQPVVTKGPVAGRKLNFVPILTQDQVDHLLAQARALGHPLVIKTHCPVEAPVQALLATGDARAHAVYRDLRDMALSMMDHGRRARATGRPAFSEIATLADARRGIDDQLEKLASWLSQPGVAALDYDLLAFETEAAAARILTQLDLDGNPRRIAKRVLTREFIQRNKAVRDRHKSEMSAADHAAFEQAYAPFYRMMRADPPALPLPPGTDLRSAMDTAAPGA